MTILGWMGWESTHKVYCDSELTVPSSVERVVLTAKVIRLVVVYPLNSNDVRLNG